MLRSNSGRLGGWEPGWGRGRPQMCGSGAAAGALGMQCCAGEDSRLWTIPDCGPCSGRKEPRNPKE